MCDGRIHAELLHCLVTEDQWDYVQSVPEEHGGKELFQNYQSNTDIFFLNLLLLPSKISNDHLTNKKFVKIDSEDETWFSRIELIHLFLAVLFDCVEEDWSFSSRSYEARFWSDGSMSIHFLSCIGMVAVVPTSSLACGFAFAFDLAATTLILVCGTWSSLWICRNFCIILIWIDHIFDRSIGYSDPRLRIVLIHRPNSNFNSIFEVLKTGCDFQKMPNSHVSLNPSFCLWSWIVSRQSVFATSHWTKLS